MSSTAAIGLESSSAEPPAPPPVLFIGGLGRSGTTLLERVIGQLPGACSVGELVHLWQRGVLDDEVCGCGTTFSQCPFWTEVGDRAFGGWDAALAHRMIALQTRVDRTRFLPRLVLPRRLDARRADLAEYVGNVARLHRAISAVSGASVVIDSSKHASLAFCLRTTRSIDLRVLHVVRDSRGVAYSWTKEVRRPEAGDENALMTRYSPARSALLWVGHNLSFSLLGLLGTRTHLVRYEDFVASPGPTLERLAKFVGLPSGPSALAFLDGATASLSPSHTVAGNPMRFRTGATPLRRDDAWREQLPTHRRRLVAALTLPLLARYGYLRRQQ